MEQYLYFGSLGPHERQFQIPNFTGLALEPAHDREMKHDLAAALPYPAGSIAKIQAQDVLEHLAFDKVPFVLDEIYRVLKPGGIFRLSVPDYRCPVLKRRSIYDARGRVIGDLLMGAASYLDPATGEARVRFSEDGEAHLWFPRYELITHLVLKSEIRKAQIHFYQGFLDDHTYLCEPVPENEMFVQRAAPHDQRAGGAPISSIADFVK
ncbi:MAG TPA: methyltransferase domain-containing protein [Rhizomicrobium sp.]|nr:methyltransferase domain-containing protein [Rhizomicrobium sp.]